MDAEDKTLRGIDGLQQGIKLVADLSVKGCLFHLGITAFSITFGFDRPPSAKIAIIVANILVNMFAGLSILFVGRTLGAKRLKLISLYDKLGIDIGATSGTRSSLHWTTKFYALFCLVLSIFWIIAFWLPSKPVEVSARTHAAAPTATP